MCKHGKLIFRYGAMNSGKSLQLLAMAHNFTERGITNLLIKSSLDTRDGNNVIHSRALGDKECIMVNKEDNLYDLISSKIGEGLQWVLVDEAQFLTEQQVDELAAVCDMLCINIVCYGLRTDFKTKLFTGSKRLFEVADTIEELKSSCSCGSKNIFNARKDKHGNIVTDGKQIEVGGEDRYVALCRKCYNIFTNNQLYI
jgi:thymidine kinase